MQREKTIRKTKTTTKNNIHLTKRVYKINDKNTLTSLEYTCIFKRVYIYIYIYTDIQYIQYIYIYINLLMYLYGERERERDNEYIHTLNNLKAVSAKYSNIKKNNNK